MAFMLYCPLSEDFSLKSEEKCLEQVVYFMFHRNARIQRDLEDSGLPFRYTAKAQMLGRLIA